MRNNIKLSLKHVPYLLVISICESKNINIISNNLNIIATGDDVKLTTHFHSC